MGARQYHPDYRATTEGAVRLESSFLTAGTSNPTVGMSATLAGNTLRGDGITTITRTAAGTFLVTLEPGNNFRYVVAQFAALDAANSGDGAYATIAPASNAGTITPLTFVVYTHAAGGTLTDFGTGGTGTARRLNLSFTLKQTGVGK